MLWLVISVMASALVPITLADVEPNDDIQSAELVTPGTYQGSISSTDLWDYYKIVDIRPGQRLIVNGTFVCDVAGGANAGLSLLDSDGVRLDYDDGLPRPGAPEGLAVSWASSSSRASYVYYVSVYFYSVAKRLTQYTLTFRISEVYDAGSGTDAGNTFPTALNLGSGEYQGWMYDMDVREGDYYRVAGLKDGQELRVRGLFTARDTQYGANIETVICAEDGTELVTGYALPRAAADSTTLSYTGSSQKENYTYYIVVRCYVSPYRDFKYSLTVSVIDHFDANSGGDVGGGFNSAYHIAPGVYSGHLGGSNTGVDSHESDDSLDLYMVDMSTVGNLSLRVEPEQSLRVEVKVYGPDRDQLASRSSANPGAVVRLEVMGSVPGTYYVGLGRLSGTWGDYSFNLTIIVPKTTPTISLSLSKTSANVGDSITASGTISPFSGSISVNIAITGPDGTSQATVTSTDGSFSYTFTADKEGSYTVRASIQASSNYNAAQSSQVTATVQKKQCVIATATFGSELSPEVSFLRGFRDDFVLETYGGSRFYVAFDAFYYSWSTPVAVFIGQHSAIRDLVKLMIYPLIGALKLTASLVLPWFNAAPEIAVVTAGFIASFLIGLIYFFPPALAIRYALSKIRTVKPVTKRFLKHNALFVLLTIPAIAIGIVIDGSILTTIAASVGVLATVVLATSTGLHIVEGRLLLK